MLAQGEELVFDFNDCRADSVEVEIRLLPNHPIDGEQLGFILSLDNKYSAPITYETKGRSEEWKENVLRNQAIRRVILPVGKEKHRLTIKALGEGVVLDQILLYR